jgi:hypothetical protein
MYTLIDCTNYSCLGRHTSYSLLGSLAYIQYANVDTFIFTETNIAQFARFDAGALCNIINRIYPREDHVNTPDTSALRKMAATAISNAAHLILNFDPRAVESQAQFIDYIDDRPYAFQPTGIRPKLCQRWLLDPQANRSRLVRGKSPVFVAPAAPLVPYAPPAATRVAPTVQAARTAAPSGPVQRPKGGSTGKVWDIADALAQGTPDGSRELRRLIIEKCVAEGINETTAGVQYSKWKKFHNL